MDFSLFTAIDYAVFALMIVSVLFAAVRGFIGSSLSLIGWILSFYLTYLLLPYLKPYIDERISNPVAATIVGYMGLLIILLILIGILNMLILMAIGNIKKGLIDRSLGAFFGLFRGALIISFIYLSISISINILHGSQYAEDDSDKNIPNWLKKAQSYNMIKAGGDMLSGIIPNSFNEMLIATYDHLSKKTQDERFINYTVDKLSKFATAEELKQIQEYSAEASLTQSAEEVELEVLKRLLSVYHKNIKQNEDKHNRLSQAELARLDSILNKNSIDGDQSTQISTPQ